MQLTMPSEGVHSRDPGAMMYTQHFHSITTWAAARVAQDGIECHYGDYVRPREAARLCAHAIRIEAMKFDDDEHAWARAGIHSKGLVDPEVAEAIDSTDRDDRMAAGADLHRGLRPFGTEADPVRHIARWLMTDPTDCPAAGHLARWTIHNGSTVLRNDAIWLAWWSMHAPTVLEELEIEPTGDKGGRPPLSDQARREQLRIVVRRIHQTGRWTKTAIAHRAGISRPTLDSWLGNGSSPAPQ